MAQGNHLAVEAFLNTRAAFLAGYNILHQEIGETSYYGYQNKEGKWYIQRAVITSAITTYTYAAGRVGYAAAWANRALETYEDIKTTFGD